MLKIGLTGGIGSGKTTVAKIFELLGVPVYYADDEAKRLMNQNEELKRQIKQQFGEEAYLNDELDRKFLADRVFADPFLLEILNSLIHPVTIQDAEQWMLSKKTPYTIKEAALLFEAGAAEKLDYIIGVYAPKELRIRRTMERSNMSRGEVLKRMDRQMDENIKMKLCDFVLKNDEQELLIPQVLVLHEKLLTLTNEKKKV